MSFTSTPFKSGFTLIELLIVMGVSALLIGYVFVNIIGATHRVSMDATIDSLMTDLKDQQGKSMNGDREGGPGGSAYGAYFGTTSYILFRGSSYDPAVGGNFNVKLGSNVEFVSTGQIVFAQGSGDVVGGGASVALKDTQTLETKTLTINKYGAVTAIN